MKFETRILLSMAALLWVPYAIAQATLGTLLDAGARPLSPAEFKEELVQRMIVGPTLTGGNLELMYVTNGTIEGQGLLRFQPTTPPGPVRGEWKADDLGRICTSIIVSGTASTPGVQLPARCQYWFKLGTRYFFSDSDTDSSAKVLSRTIKQ